ncbi:MAG: ribose-phosphate pyrophosphokinase [Candidatus Competibacteraceae bacterium]|nr:ribose-phosphate pyrophosphokinase [Candidatus Competibacteraceae bacterium]
MLRVDPCLLALEASRDFGKAVAHHLGVELCPLEERDFEDGEHKIRPLTSVRDRDVFVIHSLYGEPDQSANDKLLKLLFLIAALRDHGAARITAVVPYLCYARKDRRTKLHDPVTSRYTAQLFEAVGTGRLLALEVHNPAALENAFRIPVEHLESGPLFIDTLLEQLQDREAVVVSPDSGGAKRADRFRELLQHRLDREVPLAFMEKQRSEGVVSGKLLVGEVEGRMAIIVDDLIASGTTLTRAARACREGGAVAVQAACAHGLFVKDAATVLADQALDRVWVGDTVPGFRLDKQRIGGKVQVISAAPLFAEAIGRIHRGDSVAELLQWQA